MGSKKGIMKSCPAEEKAWKTRHHEGTDRVPLISKDDDLCESSYIGSPGIDGQWSNGTSGLGKLYGYEDGIFERKDFETSDSDARKLTRSNCQAREDEHGWQGVPGFDAWASPVGRALGSQASGDSWPVSPSEARDCHDDAQEESDKREMVDEVLTRAEDGGVYGKESKGTVKIDEIKRGTVESKPTKLPGPGVGVLPTPGDRNRKIPQRGVELGAPSSGGDVYGRRSAGTKRKEDMEDATNNSEVIELSGSYIKGVLAFTMTERKIKSRRKGLGISNSERGVYGGEPARTNRKKDMEDTVRDRDMTELSGSHVRGALAFNIRERMNNWRRKGPRDLASSGFGVEGAITYNVRDRMKKFRRKALGALALSGFGVEGAWALGIRDRTIKTRWEGLRALASTGFGFEGAIALNIRERIIKWRGEAFVALTLDRRRNTRAIKAFVLKFSSSKEKREQHDKESFNALPSITNSAPTDSETDIGRCKFEVSGLCARGLKIGMVSAARSPAGEGQTVAQTLTVEEQGRRAPNMEASINGKLQASGTQSTVSTKICSGSRRDESREIMDVLNVYRSVLTGILRTVQRLDMTGDGQRDRPEAYVKSLDAQSRFEPPDSDVLTSRNSTNREAASLQAHGMSAGVGNAVFDDSLGNYASTASISPTPASILYTAGALGAMNMTVISTYASKNRTNRKSGELLDRVKSVEKLPQPEHSWDEYQQECLQRRVSTTSEVASRLDKLRRRAATCQLVVCYARVMEEHKVIKETRNRGRGPSIQEAESCGIKTQRLANTGGDEGVSYGRERIAICKELSTFEDGGRNNKGEVSIVPSSCGGASKNFCALIIPLATCEDVPKRNRKRTNIHNVSGGILEGLDSFDAGEEFPVKLANAPSQVIKERRPTVIGKSTTSSSADFNPPGTATNTRVTQRINLLNATRSDLKGDTSSKDANMKKDGSGHEYCLDAKTTEFSKVKRNGKLRMKCNNHDNTAHLETCDTFIDVTNNAFNSSTKSITNSVTLSMGQSFESGQATMILGQGTNYPEPCSIEKKTYQRARNPSVSSHFHSQGEPFAPSNMLNKKKKGPKTSGYFGQPKAVGRTGSERDGLVGELSHLEGKNSKEGSHRDVRSLECDMASEILSKRTKLQAKARKSNRGETQKKLPSDETVLQTARQGASSMTNRVLATTNIEYLDHRYNGKEQEQEKTKRRGLSRERKSYERRRRSFKNRIAVNNIREGLDAALAEPLDMRADTNHSSGGQSGTATTKLLGQAHVNEVQHRTSRRAPLVNDFRLASSNLGLESPPQLQSSSSMIANADPLIEDKKNQAKVLSTSPCTFSPAPKVTLVSPTQQWMPLDARENSNITDQVQDHNTDAVEVPYLPKDDPPHVFSNAQQDFQVNLYESIFIDAKPEDVHSDLYPPATKRRKIQLDSQGSLLKAQDLEEAVSPSGEKEEIVCSMQHSEVKSPMGDLGTTALQPRPSKVEVGAQNIDQYIVKPESKRISKSKLTAPANTTEAVEPKSSTRKRKPPAKSPYFSPPVTPVKKAKVAGDVPLVKQLPRKQAPGGITSCIPFPPLSSPHFGLIQEKLVHDPFHLLIAVTFLNRTHGKHAIPVFYQLMERYPTPQSLAEATKEEIVKVIHRLGFQNQRADTYQRYAKVWLSDPPARGKRHPVRNYPTKGVSARDIKKDEILLDDDSRTAWEIGHLTGGPYALDSWRIFCRDILRGVATSYNGEDAQTENFQPEWMRVLPEDKELRAFLRWMWLKEGFEWDPSTGEKEVAGESLMRAAMEGRIAWDDKGGMRVLEGLVDPDTGDVGIWTQDGDLEYLSAEMQIYQ